MARLPLFPLNLVLFPGEHLPLHIFETRYREMIRYCQTEDKPFGVLLVQDEAMASVGCLARIKTVIKSYADGRSDIRVRGEGRFRVTESYEDRAYLTADIQPISEPQARAAPMLRERIIAQHLRFLELLGEAPRPARYENVDYLSYLIAQQAGLTLAQKQALLEMPAEQERMTFLVEHLADMIPRVVKATEERRRVRSNGHFK